MKAIVSDLANWPVRKSNEPVFFCTNDALLYAQLIFDKQDKQDWLTICRSNAYAQLSIERKRQHPNYHRMMDLAVRAQFFREALQEVQRINDEGYDVPPSLKH